MLSHHGVPHEDHCLGSCVWLPFLSATHMSGTVADGWLVDAANDMNIGVLENILSQRF